jgi:hypothetical protein
VLWKEFVAPLIAIGFVSGSGKEERDNTPPSETEKAGKFWVYEQAIRIPYYAIFDAWKDNLEVYHLFDNRYSKIQPNDRGHYVISPMGVELGLQQQGTTTWLRWWDESGNLLLTGDERAVHAEVIADQQKAIADQQKAIATQATLAQQQAEANANQERQQKENLEAYLRSISVNLGDLR